MDDKFKGKTVLVDDIEDVEDNLEDKKDSRKGLGFSDARGDSYRQSSDIPAHNGLNVNNDPKKKAEKDRQKR